MPIRRQMPAVCWLWLGLTVMFGSACEDQAGTSGALCSRVDCGEGVCYELDERAYCECNPGYVAVGLDCRPDPCSPSPCVYGLCRVLDGKASCRCDGGYAGERCNECASGYMPRGAACVPGDPCEGDPCVFGLCSIVSGVTTCTCHVGYTGEFCDVCDEGFFPHNLRCFPDTPCEPNPCVRGECRVDGDLSLCDCHHGYAGDICDDCAQGYRAEGVLCVKDSPVDDPCEPNPCPVNDDSNRDQCVAVDGAVVCSCAPGFVLRNDRCVDASDPSLNPCEPNPCEEASKTVCVAAADDYLCLCDEGTLLDPESGDCFEDLSNIPARDCAVLVEFPSNSPGPLYVRGEHNDWGLSDRMEKSGGLWRYTYRNLAAGDYAYKIYDAAGNTWHLDNRNPFTMYSGGQQNSRLRSPDCNRPLLTLDADPQVGANSIRFTASVAYGRDRTPLDTASIRVFLNGELTDSVDYDPIDGVFTVNASSLAPGKYSYRFSIADVTGRKARALFVPVWIENEPFDWRDATLYFVLTDRFLDGDPSNNRPVSGLTFATNWQGGDFAGIKAKIDSGYFEDMGVNALWISSPIMNTQGAFPGSDGHRYSGYHSYWPIATGWTEDNHLSGVQPIDPQFGTMAELKELVRAAHRRGIRVIADFVANHVHTDSPYWAQYRNASDPWFHFIDGNPYVCGWEKPIECWFAEYLPDFRYRNIHVMRMVMDHAIWLIQETNIDGFRLDAVKHMVLDFSTTIRAHVDEEIDTTPGNRFYMVGETFTGDNEQSTIAYYVGKDMLDGQFDFPLFWRTLKVLIRYESNLYELQGFTESNVGYYGPDSVMSNFIGNHDVPRAISHATGEIADLWGNGSKEQGWNNPPQTPTQEWPYKRLNLAWTFLFTQQGVPLIYYGDEVGIPGAGDPDNRRMMIFGNALNTQQRATLEHVQKLGKARLANAALRRGSLQTRIIENDLWAYTMSSGADGALVVLNRGNARTLSVGVGGVFSNGTVLRDVISGATATVTNNNLPVSIGGGMSALFMRQ